MKEIRIGGIILSRIDSRRLPGKALKNLGKKPLVDWVIDATCGIESITPVLATSIEKLDSPLVTKATEKGIDYFIGSKDDIADRIIKCCEKFDFNYFFRINGDSPFINTRIITEAIAILQTDEYEFISNLIDRTYPYGIACELIKFDNFKKNYQRFSQDEKEHITSFYYKHIKEFKFAELAKLNPSQTDLRLTVDTKSDLEMMNEYVKRSTIDDFNNVRISKLAADFREFVKRYSNNEVND